jgi:hypothetical protein
MSEDLLRVRLDTLSPKEPIFRQTPNSKGIWGKYQFFVNSDIQDYHFWVLYEAPMEIAHGPCNPENVIYVTVEPPALRQYPDEYLAQFATVITCHRTVTHPDVRFTQQAIPWYFGSWHQMTTPPPRGPISYEEFKTINPPKPRCLAAVSSNLRRTKGHWARLNFVQELKTRLGDRVDIYGRGIRDFGDKSEPIADYKYHIAIENSQIPDYWTEKLADPFLGNAFPFYFGCPNIHQYFPAGSYQLIDIHDLQGSINIIENSIAANTWENSQPQLKQARELVLDRYNLFALLAGVMDTKYPHGPKQAIQIRPRTSFESSSTLIKRRISKMMPTWLRRRLR